MDKKKFREILFLVIIITSVVLFFVQEFGPKEAPISPVIEKPVVNIVDLCFANFGVPNENGFYDKYTLRMSLNNTEKTVSGELNFLPAEKDSKTGEFEGSVSDVDDILMARKIDAWWDTMAEGMNTKEELKIIFGEGVASILLGEMEDRGDGVYVYKYPDSNDYDLELRDISCSEIDEREKVEKYLRENIVSLSPVKAVLGGNWYVLSVLLNPNEDSGVVIYEDGHIQEKRDFIYEIGSDGEVSNLVIK